MAKQRTPHTIRNEPHKMFSLAFSFSARHAFKCFHVKILLREELQPQRRFRSAQHKGFYTAGLNMLL